jgi:hypothetical protein
MRVYGPPARTSRATLERFAQLAERLGGAEQAARAWSEAGFDDETAARWLASRCFDPGAARALAELGVTPLQAAARTRDGGDGTLQTIGFKVASGALTPRQGAARSLSSR